MWIFDNPLLPASPLPVTAPAFAVLDDGTPPPPPLALFDIQADSQVQAVVRNWEPTTALAEVQPAQGGLVEVETGAAPLYQVDAIALGPFLLAPARNPEVLQPGEFLWDVQRQRITALPPTGVQLPPGAQARIVGGRQADPTGVLPGYLLAPLRGLPVVGQISWSLSLEQELSGSIDLVCHGQTIQELRQRLRKGTELALFGCGFAVSSFEETLEEDRFYQVSIGLTSRWSRPQYQGPSFLRGEVGRTPISAGDRALDPDCLLPRRDPQNPTVAPVPQSATLVSLAAQVGVPFVPSASFVLPAPPVNPFAPVFEGNYRLKRVGPASYVDPWSVRIPKDAARDATVTWLSEAQALARVNGTYLDLTAPDAVYARNAQAGRTWNYAVEKLQISYQGDCQHTPDHRGYAVEYPHMRLEGLFSEPRESLAPPIPFSRWQRRSPKRVVLEAFDGGYWRPPASVTRIKTMSLNWDSSGPTRTYRRVTVEDGMTVQELEMIYGFRYGSWQIYNGTTGELSGSPEAWWGVVSYKTRELIFDPNYGYESGSNTAGWREARFRTETDSLEGLELSQAIQNATGAEAVQLQLEFAAYRFRQVPIIERNRKDLQRLSAFYKDSQEDPAWTATKTCNPDGTSSLQYVYDPTWAPALGVFQELTYASSFASMPNPENSADDQIKRPPLTTGEESIAYVGRQILASKNTRNVATAGGSLDLDVFIERSIEDSAQNAGFSEKAVREVYTEKTGQIPAANRKPPPYEPIEPEERGAAGQSSEIEYAHYLRTPGYEATDPVRGSLSYPAAQTLDQAILAAKTDLLLRDTQESVQYSFALPFNLDLRPWDWINLSAQGENHRVKVYSVSHTVGIEGNIEGRLLLTTGHEATQVQAGYDREIPVAIDRRPLPLPPPVPGDAPELSGGGSVRLSLESIFDAIPRGRGNF